MKKIKGLRWWIIILIGIATVINFIDRSSLAVMWPGISRDLKLSKEEYAAIISFFMIAYGISQALSGKLYDWLGTRIGFVISVVLWSISEMLHGVARSLTQFSVFRTFLALGEAGNWPGGTKAIAEWFPVNERALGQGIFNTGSSLGSVISPPLIAFLYLKFGWQNTFMIVGALGFFWIIPWWYIYKALPKDHPQVTDEERDLILAGQAAAASDPVNDNEKVPSWGELLTYKQSWSVIATRFFIDPVWWMFVSWLPIYLVEKFGFDIQQIGEFAWIPYVGAAIGCLIGGWASGYLINRGWSVNNARKGTIIFGAVFMFVGFILAAFASTPLSAVLLMSITLFGFQFSMNNIQTLPSDYFSGKSVGSLAGMGGTSAAIGVLIMIWIVPAITKTSYFPFFMMGALIVPLGMITLYLFSGEVKRVQIK